MRNRVLAIVMTIGLILAFVTFIPQQVSVQAQSGSTVTCDSTLITLLYVAEHDYGFKSSMDVTQFEKGQFKPLFDSMMTGSMMATEPAASMMGTPAAGMMGTEPAGSMMADLKPGTVQGENASCTNLRAEVEGYLYAKFSATMKK